MGPAGVMYARDVDGWLAAGCAPPRARARARLHMRRAAGRRGGRLNGLLIAPDRTPRHQQPYIAMAAAIDKPEPAATPLPPPLPRSAEFAALSAAASQVGGSGQQRDAAIAAAPLTALLALKVAAGAGSQHEATPDCPRGPTRPCREPAAPVLASGFAASNLFSPGETDARNVTYACTYRPMVTLVNATRLLAIGACVPAACEERKGFCNGLHLLGASTKGDCWAGCMKHSDNGGRSWSRIERVMPSDTDFWVGMLLRERRTGDILLQRVMPSFKPNPGRSCRRARPRGVRRGARRRTYRPC